MTPVLGFLRTSGTSPGLAHSQPAEATWLDVLEARLLCCKGVCKLKCEVEVVGGSSKIVEGDVCSSFFDSESHENLY